jgi:hypothetical protein
MCVVRNNRRNRKAREGPVVAHADRLARGGRESHLHSRASGPTALSIPGRRQGNRSGTSIHPTRQAPEHRRYGNCPRAISLHLGDQSRSHGSRARNPQRPDRPQLYAVLAAVKAWPGDSRARRRHTATASLDHACARRHGSRAGRDEETGSGRTKKLT